ncbi:hypothetical protein C0991_004277 [Blastosporella zonata]|nr:hypothetical protein C0991_004277 [Blastosporella zonata]
MISATRDLERIVMAAEGTDVEDREGETKEELHMQGLQIQEVDVVMQDATPAPLTKSWVVLPPPSPTSEPDWEMVEK